MVVDSAVDGRRIAPRVGEFIMLIIIVVLLGSAL